MEQVNNGSVIDVSDATFQQEVIEHSFAVPVVVDFWAPWCAPCRMLSPTLERLAQEGNGAFVLAKINVDDNQQSATQYGVQGIPAVKAFRDGRVVSEFVGAQPEPTVRQFLKEIVPSETDGWVAEAAGLVAAGRAEDAENLYRKALVVEPAHTQALLGLGGLLLAQGEVDQAIQTLKKVPYGGPERKEAERLLAQARLRQGATDGNEAAYRQRIADNGNDLEARMALISIFASREAYPDALEELLEVVRRDRKEMREEARQRMLDIFNVLGNDNPLAREYRNKLASALF